MARFVDTPLDNGDANKAVAALDEAIRESSVPAPSDNRRPTDSRTTVNSNQTDPRFAGKSTDDVIKMYTNLESHSGRLASQVGEARQTINAMILGKRDNDLRQNGQAEPAKIKSADLFADPTETLNRYLDSRSNPEVSSLKDRLAQLEQNLSQATFDTRHPNAAKDTADPEFARWVQQTPLRMNLAAKAAKDDFQAAEMLLTEYTVAKTAADEPVLNARSRTQDLARRVSLEQGGSGSDSGTVTGTSTRTLKRADIIRLRQTDPDKYESPAYQKEITRAYIENRVVD